MYVQGQLACKLTSGGSAKGGVFLVNLSYLWQPSCQTRWVTCRNRELESLVADSDTLWSQESGVWIRGEAVIFTTDPRSTFTPGFRLRKGHAASEDNCHIVHAPVPSYGCFTGSSKGRHLLPPIFPTPWFASSHSNQALEVQCACLF